MNVGIFDYIRPCLRIIVRLRSLTLAIETNFETKEITLKAYSNTTQDYLFLNTNKSEIFFFNAFFQFEFFTLLLYIYLQFKRQFLLTFSIH